MSKSVHHDEQHSSLHCRKCFRYDEQRSSFHIEGLRTFNVNVVHIFHTKPAVSRRVCMSKSLSRSICFMAYICQIGMQNYISAFSELEKNIVLQPSSFLDLRQKC